MKLEEFSASPFTDYEHIRSNNFLVVHKSLVELSEFVEGSTLDEVEVLNDFYSLTYGQVNRLTNSISDEMIVQGVRQQHFLPILMKNPFDIILSVISGWRCGTIPVPLNYQLLTNELKDQLSFLNAERIVCEKCLSNNFPDFKKIIFPKSLSMKNSVRSDFISANTAVVLFTSGTAGKPKAVPLSFNNLQSAFYSGNSVFNYSEKDSWYLNLPLYHIGGFSLLIRAILAGSSLILPESNELDSLKKNLMIVKPTFVSLVPTQLKRICESKIHPNVELRAVLVGGGFADDDMLLTAMRLGWKIFKVYGSTETSAFISTLTPEEFAIRKNSVGKPLPKVDIRIFDSNKKALHQNEVGEIGVKSDSVFQKYLNNEADSIATFNKGYYLTGDFGFLDSEGFLYVENRRTDLIVSGGENISPFEIEKVILEFHNVDEVCVFGLPDKEWGEIVAATVISKNKKELDFSELMIFLKEKLPSFKLPKKYFQTDLLPKSAIGKIKRAEVKSIFMKLDSVRV